jgi:hypothetical protein
LDYVRCSFLDSGLAHSFSFTSDARVERLSLKEKADAYSKHHQPHSIKGQRLAAPREAKQEVDNVYDGADDENHSANSKVL